MYEKLGLTGLADVVGKRLQGEIPGIHAHVGLLTVLTVCLVIER